MPRWTGDWLSGPQHTLRELRSPETWPGERLGLPREGAGSIASFSARAAAFAVDSLAAGFVTAIFFRPSPDSSPLAGAWPSYTVLAVGLTLLVALTGRTLGMRVLGLRVVPIADASRPPGLGRALLRTLPLMLTVGLTAFFGRDGRGLHDMLAGTAVVRA